MFLKINHHHAYVNQKIDMLQVKTENTWLHLSVKVLPDSKFHGANMGPTWVLSALDGPHVGPINLAIGAHFEVTGVDIWTGLTKIFML